MITYRWNQTRAVLSNLDEKTKEKSIADDIKNKYGTNIGSMGMIIKQIS